MIYTLTLNPAIDRELTVPELAFDSVLRASEARVDFGGKGFNVSRLLKQLGASSTAIGFAGGHAGLALRDGLQGLGIDTDFVWVAEETRTNVSIVGGSLGHYLKVNETGPHVDGAHQAELLAKVERLCKSGDWWVMAGSLPPGVAADMYAKIVSVINRHGARAVVDTTGKALRLACAAAPFLVKPNAEEARTITGLPTGSPGEAARAAAEMRRMGAENVVISLGKLGALLSCTDGAWLARSPVIDEKNPIGAGDALVGGMVWALSEGLSLKDGLAWGVASGAATASLSGTAVGSRALIEELLPQVKLQQLETGSASG